MMIDTCIIIIIIIDLYSILHMFKKIYCCRHLNYNYKRIIITKF